MPDLGKVLKGIECCLSGKIGNCGNCPYFRNDEYADPWSCRLAIMRDALALLKEQDEKIATMRMVYGSDVNVVGEIVRCKDCKHYNTACCMKGFGWCEEGNGNVKADDWFCADGKRRDADD